MIIGGSGFFGKSLLDAFCRGQLGAFELGSITVVSRHATRFLKDHSEFQHPAITAFDADVGSVQSLPKADWVIHAAAATDARRYQTDPLGETRNMVAAMENFASIAQTDLRGSQIVFASSGAVYGTQPAELAGWAETMAERSLEGLSDSKIVYATAKRRCELIARQLGNNGIAITIARCFAFVGHYLPRDQHFAVGNFLADGLHRRPITVNARHPVYRSVMHADDLSRWLLALCAAATPQASVYNVGADDAVTVNEMAKIVSDVSGSLVVARPWDVDAVDRYIPSIQKAQRELGLGLEFATAQSAIADVYARLVGSASQRLG